MTSGAELLERRERQACLRDRTGGCFGGECLGELELRLRGLERQVERPKALAAARSE